MAIQVGDRLPDGGFQTMTRDGVVTLDRDEVFAGRRVALFAVPGAFTPTCSDTHLPGFLALADDLRQKGIDTIACLAVNDAFVLEAWSRQAGAAGHILMLADGNGDYVRALGLELDATAWGMGLRARRFAALVEDGVVRQLLLEEKPGVDAASARALLARV